MRYPVLVQPKKLVRLLTVFVITALSAVCLSLGVATAAQAASVLGTVTTSGPQPRSALFSHDGKYAYTLHGAGIDKIRLSDHTLIGSPIPVGVAPFDMVMTPSGASIFVTNEGDSTVTVISTSTDTVIATYNFSGLNAPPTGTMTPRTAQVSPTGAELYLSNSTGNFIAMLDISNPASIPLPTYVDAGIQTWALAMAPGGSRLWVGDRSSAQIFEVNTGSNFSMGARVALHVQPSYLEFSPNGQYLFVTDTQLGRIERRDGTTGTTTAGGITNGLSLPGYVAFSPDSKYFYSTDSASGSLITFSTATMRRTASVPVGSAPSGVTTNSTGTQFLVPLPNSDTLVVLGDPKLANTGQNSTELPVVLGVGLTAVLSGLSLAVIGMKRRRRG